MSIAYLDPGNIEGDLQAGAVAQYKVNTTYASVHNIPCSSILSTLFILLMLVLESILILAVDSFTINFVTSIFSCCLSSYSGYYYGLQ